MRTSAHMVLKVWNLLEDPYDHEQLADNWAKVDSHDHSPGRGVLIPTEGIANEAITSELLGNSSVTEPKIANGSITAPKFAPGALDLGGEWTAFSSFGSDVVERAGQQTVRARLEIGNAIVRLRGVLETTAEITGPVNLGVLPVGFRPSEPVYLPTNFHLSSTWTSLVVEVSTSGVLSIGPTLKSGAYVPLDGLTFNLT